MGKKTRADDRQERVKALYILTRVHAEKSEHALWKAIAALGVATGFDADQIAARAALHL